MRVWLLATGTIYALGAVDFIARPRAATSSLNSFAGGPDNEIEPENPPGVYNSLAAAYMATIAALALTASKDPETQRALIPPLLVAKAGSSAALFYRYAQTRKTGFAVAAGLDAFLFGATAGLLAALDR
jgi:hypothetical protein